MTTAAMRVLPRPVGRATMVLVNSAVLVMDNWYWRQGILAAQNRNTDIKYKDMITVQRQWPTIRSEKVYKMD
jgi:hypothetical protein